MASSDDEGEAVAQSVMNYHFVDDKDEPVSFSSLPIQWSEDEIPDAIQKQIFLHGTADSGLQKIYKQVTSWKFELSDDEPAVLVLSKGKNWIKLQKPRKIFEDTVRTILITVHCLHSVKKDPEISGKSLWDHLRKVFSLYEVRPSENDLLDHLPLIRVAVTRDKTLSKSKFLLSFLENPKKRNAFDEDVHTVSEAKKNKFIVDDDEELDGDIGASDGDDSDEDTDLFDSVCAICDNGGEILCCEGRCLRSFHATIDDGAESDCKSLGLSKVQVKAIQNFSCKNCRYKQHQCFACGKLGSSDKSSGAEVFSCVSATCGYFYHPECVAKLLHPENEAEAEEFQKKIAAGESFTCPVHKCLVCKEGENKEVHELQFAMCRRCPKAYHRKCLPRKIAFEDLKDEGIITRAWDDLLPNNRVLIYCLKHKIEENIGTPIRNHIIFPYDDEKKKARPSELQSSKGKIVAKKRSVVSEDSSSEKSAMKTPKQVEKVPCAVKDSGLTKKSENHFSREGFDFSKKSKMTEASRRPLKDSIKSISMKVDNFTADESKVSLGEEKFSSLLNKGSEPVKSNQQDIRSSKFEKTMTTAPLTKRSSSSLPLVDAETRKRIMGLMEKKTLSITLEEVVKKHKVPSTHAYSSKNVVDKTITQGKVEGFVEAVRTALQKLEGGCSIEDAKAVCGPDILVQIIKWKNKLNVYLAPFIHGMRYTSFGRHFTKVDKLREIVDKLHWYVQNGDMIVDFCCGANDFSCLMKEKLEETGKKCSFKNYDVIQPKNDFNFEKRDWMGVRPKELPTGSQLIMGLNPPFGVKAALANKFIDKALEFKPKLLILIVPKETERLDGKKAAYDLVWEDEEKLSGKSFYLPGSVDVNDKQMEQWNLKPPMLYLWSRPDWSTKHRGIALKQGHISKEQKESHVEENHNQAEVSDMDISPSHDYFCDISKKLINDYGDISNQINYLPEQKAGEPEEARAIVPEEQKESSLLRQDTRVDQSKRGDDGREDHKNHGRRKKRSRDNRKERQDKGKQSKSKAETPPEGKYDRGRPQGDEIHTGMPPRVSSPLNRTNPRSLPVGQPSDALEVPPERAVSEEGFRRLQLGFSGSGSEFGIGLGGTRTSIPDEDLDAIARRYSANKGETYASGTQNWAMGTNLGQEYGIRGLGEQFPGYTKDTLDSFGRTPYSKELDEKYRREADMRLHLRLYGQQGPDSSSQSNYLPSQDAGFGKVGSLPSTPYGLLGSAAEASYNRMNSSAMQRYAPRLDELNHTRMGNFGPETPQVGRIGMLDNPSSRIGFHPDSLGFTPGPPRHFPHQNSSGWLNE